ncbi:MAG: acyl-CoA dehydrogenase family protein [Syntrophaceae bacterium]
MALPDRNNPYNFDEFLAWRRNIDYYRDDAFLGKVLRRYAGASWASVEAAMEAFSPKVSLRWRDIADTIAAPEKRPYMMHYDGHHHRIDRIVRPAETLVMEKEIFGEGLFSVHTDPWVRLTKLFLIYQNGEACVACPLVCTEGLIALLDRYADAPELKYILKHCKEGLDGRFAIGAQYLSEIQGGSDVGANVLEAVQEGSTWRLFGTKFFCSATHADYAVVTAKPLGSEKVALFVIPSWLPGDKDKEKRNGYTIDRIKWKMGTSELTTAELTFGGAVAYPVGPLDRGLANVVGIVLTYSRLTVGLSGAASITRASREAAGYARARTAFGMNIADFPLLKIQLSTLERAAKRTAAGAFKLYHEFLSLPGGLKGGMSMDEAPDIRGKRFAIRELIMLQKIAAAWDATDMLRLAMSVFGGHGVMEDFSSLPRLYRDAAVNELWEGPRNVLLTQIHRDFQRASTWYAPAQFVADILTSADPATIAELAQEMEALIGAELLTPDLKALQTCEQWDRFCHTLFHAYQDQAVAEVEG